MSGNEDSKERKGAINLFRKNKKETTENRSEKDKDEVKKTTCDVNKEDHLVSGKNASGSPSTNKDNGVHTSSLNEGDESFTEAEIENAKISKAKRAWWDCGGPREDVPKGVAPNFTSLATVKILKADKEVTSVGLTIPKSVVRVFDLENKKQFLEIIRPNGGGTWIRSVLDLDTVSSEAVNVQQDGLLCRVVGSVEEPGSSTFCTITMLIFKLKSKDVNRWIETINQHRYLELVKRAKYEAEDIELDETGQPILYVKLKHARKICKLIKPDVEQVGFIKKPEEGEIQKGLNLLQSQKMNPSIQVTSPHNGDSATDVIHQN